MAQNWTITGDYVEAFNGDVVCECFWMETPDDDFAWDDSRNTASLGDVELVNAWTASHRE